MRRLGEVEEDEDGYEGCDAERDLAEERPVRVSKRTLTPTSKRCVRGHGGEGTHHRHPIESASSPPSGAPVDVPDAKMMLIYPCHTPLSLSGTISEMRMDTTLFIPPPPMPAMARATHSCTMSRASPHPRHPSPKTVYAKRRHSLRPKMSLSLP